MNRSANSENKKDGIVCAKTYLSPNQSKGYSIVPTLKLENEINLNEDEKNAIKAMHKDFPVKISTHFASLLAEKENGHPLRKIVIPSINENNRYAEDEEKDVHIDEAKYQPVEGIIHRYPGKLLFFPTLDCVSNCRFCFRSDKRVTSVLSKKEMEKALDYIRNTKEVRDVVITGGDPMTLSIDILEYILKEISSVDHVEIIRIGTRSAAFAPQILSQEMVDMISKYNPIIFKFTFLHPDEITEETIAALKRVGDKGIVMMCQGPILRGINDSSGILKELYETLIKHRVIPYYLIYGIYSKGTSHFRVSREDTMRIISELENNTSGFCVPTAITLDQNDDKTRKMN